MIIYQERQRKRSVYNKGGNIYSRTAMHVAEGSQKEAWIS